MKNNKIPMYKKIADEIKEMIVTGKLKPNDKLPSENELAIKYGVSRITSREALDELKKEGFIIRKKKFGSYVNPNIKTNGVSVPQLSTRNIGLILPFSDTKERNMEYIKGAFDYLHSKNYNLSVYSSDGYAEKERYYLEYLSYNGFDGILYYPIFSIENFDIVFKLLINNYPIVLIDKYFEGINVPSVTSDNFAGLYEATKYLIELGHRQIAFISGVPLHYTTSIKNRFLGYLKALYEANLQYNTKWFIKDYNLNLEDAAKKEILNKAIIDDKITAIIAEYDYVALDIIKAIKSLGYTIPDDISIVGFDNIDLLDHIEVPLTTIEQNFYNIGWKAAEILVNIIEKNECIYDNIQLPVKLVVRDSTAPNKNNDKLTY